MGKAAKAKMKVTIGLKQYILIITGVVLIAVAAPHVGKVFLRFTPSGTSPLWNWRDEAETIVAVGAGILTGGLLSMFSKSKRKK